MQIWERGREHERTLLFLPCTAEPVWAFSESVALLSRKWHVFQVIYDGHQPEYSGDFTSVEQTVDEVTAYLKSRGIVRLDAAYGCSLGGVPDLPAGIGRDAGMFNRAYYLSGAYGLWKPVLIVGMGAVGAFLYYFMVKALHADMDEKYRKTRLVHSLCGIFTVAVALAIHLWSATLAWFAAYLGSRIGSEAAVTAVTAYQDDMLIAILPMYFPMVVFIGIHFVMLLIGKTRYPRWMLLFHPVAWNILLVVIPDIAQTMQVPAATWMAVMSQSSTNTSIVIWCIAAAIYEKKCMQKEWIPAEGGSGKECRGNSRMA